MQAYSFLMPRRFLRGSYLSLSLTVVALACGVAMVCAIDLANAAVLRAFVEVVDAMSGRAALLVRAGEGGLFPEEVADAVGRVPGVELAVPVVEASAFAGDASGETLVVQGVDITNDEALRVYQTRDAEGLELADPLVVLSQPDSVILTRAFAGRRGLAVGDAVFLVTPGGRQRFTVRGLLDPQGVARVYGGNLVVMDLFAAERVFTHPRSINRVDVVIRHGQDVRAVGEAIRAVLPSGLDVQTPAERKLDLDRLVRSLQVLLQAVMLVGLVAAFLIAFGRLSTVFEARAWQLGILRAVGVRPRVVWRELVKESLLLGAAGVALGLPLGIGLAHVLLPAMAVTTALNCKLIAPQASLGIRAPSLVMAVSLGLVAAVAAAAGPAWRATRVDPARVLGQRGVELPGAARVWPWLLRALAGAGVAVALVLQATQHSAAWGLVATALIAVGLALAARPVLYLLGPLMAALALVTGPTGRFATAVLGRNPRRSALTVAMLGVGLGTVLWFWTVAESFERTLAEALTNAWRADLAITSSHVLSGYVEAPLARGLLAELASVPGVAAVAGNRIIDWHHAGASIAINALDPAYLRDPGFGSWPLEEGKFAEVWPRVLRGEAVTVSRSFAVNLDVRVGDDLTIDAPSGPLTLPVAGIVTDFLSARGTIEMSRDVYERFWQDEQVTFVLVRLAPGAERDAVRAAIARTLGKQYDLRVLTPAELVSHYRGEVRRAFAGVDLLRVLVSVVVLIGMADSLTAGVAERTRELGSLRALGVRPRAVRRMVLLEAVLLGTVGLALALVGGLGLGVLWVRATFAYLLGWVVELYIPYRQVLDVSLTTIVVCLVAALLPAYRAASLEPAVALRHE